MAVDNFGAHLPGIDIVGSVRLLLAEVGDAFFAIAGLRGGFARGHWRGRGRLAGRRRCCGGRGGFAGWIVLGFLHYASFSEFILANGCGVYLSEISELGWSAVLVEKCRRS